MMQSVIFKLGWRHTTRRFFQSVLFIIGVALGVAVVIAIDLANNSASRAFSLSSASVSGSATHQIVGNSGTLDSAIYTQLRLNGFRLSAPVVAQYVRAEDVPQPLRLLGVDPFAEPPFRDYLTSIEVINEDEIDSFQALSRFIVEPNTLLMSESLAEDAGVSAGDMITISASGNPREMRVIGVLRPNDALSQQALDDLLLTDIATAQEIGSLEGQISRIDLILNDDLEASAIAASLPDNASLVSVSETNDTLAQMTRAFEINLQALSLLAVVVGVFLIYNTVTFSVIQRRPMIGILRSLGATKRQIFGFIIGEALILGFIGTLLGVGLGLIFGRFTVQLVSQSISDLYFTVNVQGVSVDPLTLLKGAAIGLVASGVAALIPSIDATRTPPAGSMRRSSLEEATLRLVPYITVAAIAFLIIGYLILLIPSSNLFLSFTALFFIIFGGALWTPLVLILIMRIATPIMNQLFGVVGRIAPRAVVRSLSRTSVAVAALTIAVSVIIGVSVMIGSFRSTVANWLENTLSADIYISPPNVQANISSNDVDPAIAELVRGVEGIERASTNRTRQISAPDYPDLPPVNLNVVDFDLPGAARGFVWTTADDPTQALLDGQIMVSEPFAFRRDISREDNTLTLLTDSGEREFTIFGVFYDYTSDQGNVYISRSVYDQYWTDPFISAVAAFITPDADLDAVIRTLETETLAAYDLDIQSNRDLRTNVFEVFDRTFAITYALRLLATMVAFIGILSALMSLQLEHTREYGVMRATGMTPTQLRGYTFMQTGLMGITAGLLALPIGLLLSLVLIYVINVRSFGWTMQFALIPSQFLEAFIVAIAAALLAGVYPAYRLAKMNVSEAIRSE